MLIEVYFQQIQDLLENCEIMEFCEMDYESRGFYEGFIRGKINFRNNSCLHLREFVYVEITINRKMYGYQYMDAENNLIFRYDNTEHHKKLNLPNFPHHKHDGSEKNIVSSDAPFLAAILKEIQELDTPRRERTGILSSTSQLI